jgi:hypothetical protein
MSGRRAEAFRTPEHRGDGMTDWNCALPGGVGGAVGTAVAVVGSLGTLGGAVAAGTGALLALVAYYAVTGLPE